ncbi:hypothetical protein [Aeromicrobium sp. NPDC092404]|uniref:hypothetical protein n=1 Tax=Aeromicrobium sp. NPDC092404 TaxID=3154976 RepID=UPI00342BC6A7
MFDSRGLPDYPPPHNAWEFPPPPVSRRWKWVAIAAMVLGLVATAGGLVTVIAVGSAGTPGLIDDAELISVIERECEQMTSEVESLTIEGSPESQAKAISAQNAAIEEMVDGIRSVGPELLASDPPVDEWLTDWGRLVRARNAYVEEMLRGSFPDLDIPTDDRGEDIWVRMDDVFLTESTCEVPVELLDPFPDDASDV